MKRIFLAGSSGLALIVASAGAHAQTAPATQSAPQGTAPPPTAATDQANTGLKDIIVTAQRRVENAQRAPIAIDTISSATLDRRNITDATALTQIVPSAQIGQSAGPFPVFFLRGGGSFASNSLTDSAVVLSLDGVPMARQYGINGQFFDLERVEVLEGPQGTLYGRNATGGAINLIPQHPTQQFSVDGGISYGNYQAIKTNLAVNVPISSTLAVRGSFQSSNHNGYSSDSLADDDTQAGRLQLLYKPSDALSILLAGDAVHQGGLGTGFVIISNGFTPEQRVGLSDPRVQALYTSKGLNPFLPGSLYQDNHYGGVKGELNWKSSLGTLTILPAYRHNHLDFNSAFGGSEEDNETDDQESVEARFTSNDRGFLRWIVGGFYLHDDVDVNMQIDNRNGIGNQQIYDATTDSKAAFADLTAHLTNWLRLIGGVRYTDEVKSLDGSLHNPFIAGSHYVVVDDSTKADKVTWRAGMQADLTPTSMIYGTVATSFRSGGFFFTADDPAFRPENVIAYTIGSKNRFFDNKLQFNLELFEWNFRDQQLAYSSRDSAGNQIFATVNAGATHERGFELNLAYQPLRDTRIGVDVQYLHSRFRQFTLVQTSPPAAGTLCSSSPVTGGYELDCAGLTPPNSPTWVVSPNLSQDFHLSDGGTLNLLAGAHYQTHTFTAIQLVPSDRQPAYLTGDMSLTYQSPDDKWSFGAFVENLGDATIKQYTVHGAVTTAVLSPPRTYGIRAAIHFR